MIKIPYSLTFKDSLFNLLDDYTKDFLSNISGSREQVRLVLKNHGAEGYIKEDMRAFLKEVEESDEEDLKEIMPEIMESIKLFYGFRKDRNGNYEQRRNLEEISLLTGIEQEVVGKGILGALKKMKKYNVRELKNPELIDVTYCGPGDRIIFTKNYDSE